MKPARAAIGDVTPNEVELAIGEDLDARAEQRVLEIIRRIRDKHRARAGQRNHSRGG